MRSRVPISIWNTRCRADKPQSCWTTKKIYLGNQICKQDSGRCYGLAADEDHLLVCEYGDGGADAEIILFRKRKMTHGDRIVPSFCNVVFFSSEQMRIPA